MSDCCRKGRRCLAHMEADGLTRPPVIRTVRVRVPVIENIILRAQRALVSIHMKGAANGKPEKDA